MPNKTKISFIIIIALLLVSNIFFAYKSQVSARALYNINIQRQINTQMLSFTELFMAKVLRGGGDVSFDDRLQLENSVRALNDQTIITAWQTFTNAKDSDEIQQAFYTLFSLLLKKIQF